MERCGRGEFRATAEVRDWVENEWGVGYPESGMHSGQARLSIYPKVPRPQAENADSRAQEVWKKGDVHGPCEEPA